MMNKKIFITIGILIIVVVLFVGCIQRSEHITTTEECGNEICTDGIDNDSDGLIDNEDGNCWIREGALTDEVLAYEGNPITFIEYADKIPELKKRGIGTLRLTPIWEHVEGKPYSIIDYYKIDINRCVNKNQESCKQELKILVNKVHENNMHIVIDLVSAHANEDGEIYRNHKDWFLHDKDGNILNCYPSAEWGPALDRANPRVIGFFTNFAEYYIREYDIDGFWLDAPQTNYNPALVEGNHEAVTLFRKVKETMANIKQSSVLIAEVPFRGYVEMPDVLDFTPVYDEMCECSYGQIFRRDIFLKMVDNKITSEYFVNYLNKEEIILHNKPRVRFISVHDRWAAIFPYKHPELHKPAIVLISTIPGLPAVWDGELAIQGITEFYEKILNIRNNNNALKYGTIENVWKSGDNTYAYSRTYEGENVVVLINFNDKQATSGLSMPFRTGDTLKDELSEETFTVTDPGNFQISVPAYGSMILILR